jgi:hypothetical protein
MILRMITVLILQKERGIGKRLPLQNGSCLAGIASNAAQFSQISTSAL